MTLAVTVDRRWGGFYCGGDRTIWRICLGFIAVDFYATSLELYLHKLIEGSEEQG